MKRGILVAAGFALLLAPLAGAQSTGPTLPEIQSAAKQSQAACVKKGEAAPVCACGVGLAYAKLDPRVFVAAPKIDPLLDEKDPLKKIMGVAAIAQESGLSATDVQKAVDAVKANRQAVKEVCTPLGPPKK
ncbi:MAG: hypothetical protein KJS97_00265 [Alphaproteobacteria bacterium]|nr:hypothetical protein [Alphaproteobacteria bacterium]